MRANEELLRANEDVMRADEELMRANEGLPRANEDLMRANEELLRAKERRPRADERPPVASHALPLQCEPGAPHWHDILRAVAVDIRAPDRKSSRHNTCRIAPQTRAPRPPPFGASFRAATAPRVKDPRRPYPPPTRGNSLPPPCLQRYPTLQRRLAILRGRSGQSRLCRVRGHQR